MPSSSSSDLGGGSGLKIPQLRSIIFKRGRLMGLAVCCCPWDWMMSFDVKFGKSETHIERPSFSGWFIDVHSYPYCA